MRSLDKIGPKLLSDRSIHVEKQLSRPAQAIARNGLECVAYFLAYYKLRLPLLNATKFSLNSLRLTFVKSSFKEKGVVLYLSDFQNQRLLFFVTTQRISQRDEEFKSRTGKRVDRPVSFTNCLEQASNNAILVKTDTP